MGSKALFLFCLVVCLLPSAATPMSLKKYLCGYSTSEEEYSSEQVNQIPHRPTQIFHSNTDDRSNSQITYYDRQTHEPLSKESSYKTCKQSFKIFMSLSGATLCWTTGTITLPLSYYSSYWIPLSAIGWIGAIAFTKIGVAQILQACSETAPITPDPQNLV